MKSGKGFPLTISLILIGLTCACGNKAPQIAPQTPVILISVDTLRADHLPAYDYQRIQTPAIDELVSNGVLFERAFSQAPLTLPSHASILTGLLPPRHGVRENVGFRLQDESKTLAEIFAENGYQTGAAVSSMVLRKTTGISQGFQFYDDSFGLGLNRQARSYPERSGEQTLNSAMTWILGLKDKPFFLWTHLYEPHAPYAPPPPFNKPDLHPYDGEIEYTDHLLANFFKFLKEKGLYQSAIIILTSDHGEGLGDHGEKEHGLFTYREAIHTPLVVKLPNNAMAGKRVSRSVGLIDIAPTLTSLLKMEGPVFDGDHLFAPSKKDRAVYSEAMSGELFYGWHASRSVISKNLHYMEGHEPMLFDLDQDFLETQNLYGAQAIPEAASAQMDAMAGGEQATQAISDEDKAMLESLGYTGGFEMGQNSQPLSPQAFLEVYNSVKTARALIEQGQAAEAEALLQAKLQAHPAMVGLRAMLTRALYLQEKYEAAAHVCSEGLAQTPNHEGLLVAMTGVELALGRVKEAQILARKCLSIAPVVGGRKLTPLFFEKGHYALSEEMADMVGCHDPVFAMSWKALTRMAQDPDADFRIIIVETANACKDQIQAPPMPDILSFVGRGLAGLKKYEEASQLLQEALTLRPDHGETIGDLAQIYAARGLAEHAVKVVDQWVYQYPSRNNYLQASRIMEEAGIPKAAAFYRAESENYAQ